MQDYKCWVFYSKIEKLFFISTHVSFEELNPHEIKQNVATGWNRKGSQREQIIKLGHASDFNIEYTSVKSTEDMRKIKQDFQSQGLQCVNLKIQLIKRGRAVA
ncbi:hypothetical protein [Vibrio sp. SCSIO 43136]|uniref:hypothetical protein n=1 Tax=Vibrio sp. SCSIO 43136 TaxID=2819101 RepID=UPI00207522EB|nr:hypothetical protein [Vibrio sp. SCSIO 43136]USD64178.1 hypothetical protein J4N39_08620 [Vibrio sp. SCSIO 43136]